MQFFLVYAHFTCYELRLLPKFAIIQFKPHLSEQNSLIIEQFDLTFKLSFLARRMRSGASESGLQPYLSPSGHWATFASQRMRNTKLQMDKINALNIYSIKICLFNYYNHELIWCQSLPGVRKMFLDFIHFEVTINGHHLHVHFGCEIEMGHRLSWISVDDAFGGYTVVHDFADFTLWGTIEATAKSCQCLNYDRAVVAFDS